MVEIIKILIAIYTISSPIVSVLLFLGTLYDEKKLYYGCPNYIYRNSKLNKFGVFLLFLFFLILVPLYYLMWFVYWICHVGRKEEK